MKKVIFSLCCCLLPSLAAGQELFTVDEIRIMHDAGVKVQFSGQMTSQVLPAETSPGELLRVEMLDFSDSSLYRIPPWLKRFTNLRRLDLSKNHLDADNDLMETLQAMPKLDVLNLSDNPLFAKEPAASQSLGPVWQRLTELGELYLSDTGGRAQNYGSLAPLWSLQKLDLSNNRIRNEVGVLELNKLTGLEELNVSHNDISRFPGTELPVRSLRLLDLSHNDLTKISYVQMDALEIWDLQGNGAVRLEDDYGDMFSLKSIKKLQYDSGSDYDNLSKLPEGLKKKLNSLVEKKWKKLHSIANAEGRTYGKYIDNQDGTITDSKTGLMWKRCSEGLSGMNCEKGKAKGYEWDDAVKHFKNVEYAGYSDWRLPTIDELKTLVYCSNGTSEKEAWYRGGCNKDSSSEEGFERPTINQNAFPNTPIRVFWSASIENDSSASYEGSAWNVYFGRGSVFINPRIADLRIRLVRSGQ